jgi:hypothetical protein
MSPQEKTEQTKNGLESELSLRQKTQLEIGFEPLDIQNLKVVDNESPNEKTELKKGTIDD